MDRRGGRARARGRAGRGRGRLGSDWHDFVQVKKQEIVLKSQCHSAFTK